MEQTIAIINKTDIKLYILYIMMSILFPSITESNFFFVILLKLGIFNKFIKIKYPSNGKNGTMFVTIKPRLLNAVKSITSLSIPLTKGKQRG